MRESPGRWRPFLLASLLALGACGSRARPEREPWDDDEDDYEDSSSEPSRTMTQGNGMNGSPIVHAAWPQVPANAGVVAKPVTLVSIVAQNDPDASEIFAFGDALVSSAWWKGFADEYNLGTAQHVKWTGPALAPTPANGTADDGMTSAKIRSYIEGVFAKQPKIAGTPLYTLYLPVGTWVARDGKLNTNCTILDQVNNFIDEGGPRWVWIAVQRCPSSKEPMMRRMSVYASAAIAGTAADPFRSGYRLMPGTMPWMTHPLASIAGSGGAQLNYPCSRTRVFEGRWWYQRMWSNRAAAEGNDPCIPATPEPYFNVSAEPGWVKATPGVPVEIPLTAWSTGQTADWQVTGVTKSVRAGVKYEWRLVGDTLTMLGGTSFVTVNHGRTAKLVVTFDAATTSGAYVAVEVVSSHRAQDGSTPIDTDGGHSYVVGAYVP